MDIVEIKVLSGFLFFLDAIVFGCLPFFVVKICLLSKVKTQAINHSLVIQCMHSLASGVLIATCLLHLLPESLDNVRHALLSYQRTTPGNEDGATNISRSRSDLGLEENNENKPNKDEKLYPVAELFVAIGFLAVFMMDTTIKASQCIKGTNNEVKYNPVKTYEMGDDDEEEEEIELYTYKGKNSVENGKSRSGRSYVKKDKSIIHVTKNGCDSENVWYGEEEKRSDGQGTESGHLRSAALLMALCIHGFFDGVMLGLQTSASVLYSLMMALLLHKSFVATSFSLTLLGNHPAGTLRHRDLLYVLLFASVAPLGLAASAAFFNSSIVSSNGKNDFSSMMTPGFIQSFAVGTFLYVTFTETTKHSGEVTSLKYRVLSHVCLLIGFSFMALIRIAVK